MSDELEDYRPVAAWFKDDAPTDEQVRAAVAHALDDERVREAVKLAMAAVPGIPLATVLCAVFTRWDGVPLKGKLFTLAELLGWDTEWLTADTLFDHVAAWERPWDHARKGGAK